MRRLLRTLTIVTLFCLVCYYGCHSAISSRYQDVSMCFNQTGEEGTPRFITIHHDAIPQEQSVSLRDIDRFHEEVRQWSCGFAYQYYLTKDTVYKIGSETRPRAHTLNHNTDNIGICVHGDLNQDQLTTNQQINLIGLVNYLVIRYHIPKQNIKRHRDWENQHTECCGRNFSMSKFKEYIIDIDRLDSLVTF